MTKAKRYDTVILTEAIGSFAKGAKGAVVEVYTTPYEAYDLEFVGEDGGTKGLLEAVRPPVVAHDLDVVGFVRRGEDFHHRAFLAGGKSAQGLGQFHRVVSFCLCHALGFRSGM